MTWALVKLETHWSVGGRLWPGRTWSAGLMADCDLGPTRLTAGGHRPTNQFWAIFSEKSSIYHRYLGENKNIYLHIQIYRIFFTIFIDFPAFRSIYFPIFIDFFAFWYIIHQFFTIHNWWKYRDILIHTNHSRYEWRDGAVAFPFYTFPAKNYFVG